MKTGHFLMSHKELERKSVLDRVQSRTLTVAEAAVLLQVSERHAWRLWSRYRGEGAAGLAHRNRGRPSNRSKPKGFKARVLARYKERYEGLGPTLAAEKLALDGLDVDHETLRRWLLEDRLIPRRRRRSGHRSRRPPKEHFGELVQLDGSHHRWFGEDQGYTCLMNMVDDATGTTFALMFEEETTEAAMRTLWGWMKRHGIPKALYTDRKTVYVTDREPTVEEQLAGEEPMTAFGIACKKLGIEIITANSPQAKGRVERKHGVYQDRLVHELRLNGVATIEGANQLLEHGFVRQLNEKFAHAPARSRDRHRPLPKHLDLRDVFCYEYRRTLSNDWCIRYANRFFQIEKTNKPLPKPKDKIIVRIWLDGSIHLLYNAKRLAFHEIDVPPPKPVKAIPPPTPRAPQKPRPNHPWKKRALRPKSEVS